MKTILRMKNSILPYEWGSVRTLAEFMGQPYPTSAPQAELWMGAHHKAPSQVFLHDHWESLINLINAEPIKIIGQTCIKRFGKTLPFLFKILAVEQPLSIQAHPDSIQAKTGYDRENQLGIGLAAAQRNYRDDRHKPECICALTPFWALMGFRSAGEILSMLDPLWPEKYQSHLEILKLDNDSGNIRLFFQTLLQSSKPFRIDLIDSVVVKAKVRAKTDAVCSWMVRLYDRYPEDIGVLAPALLNLICLQPGQALFVPAGRLHAYLSGLAIEVMANSDNVLRGGLTNKHIDLPELLNILTFRREPVKKLEPAPISNYEAQYSVPSDEFTLSVLTLKTADLFHTKSRRSMPEILLCTQGAVKIKIPATLDEISFQKGASVFIPAGVADYQVSGEGIIYRVTVGHF